MTVHVSFRQTTTTGDVTAATPRVAELDTGPIPARSLVSRMAMLGTTLSDFRAPRKGGRRERGAGTLSMRGFLSQMAGVAIAAGAVAFTGHAALSAAPPEPLVALSQAPAAPVAPPPAVKRPVQATGGESAPAVGAGMVPLPRLRTSTEAIYDGPFERDAQGGLWVARGTFDLEDRVQLVLEDVLEVVTREDLEGKFLRMRDGALVKAWPELLEAFEALRYRKEYAAASGRGQASPFEPDTVELTDRQRAARDEAAARALVEAGVVLPHGAPAPAAKGPTTK